ncbi:hypothetical protein [Niallia sp. MER TA 168]|uniref:hypothetical protein n=1 Tax=Niallia sp. MER TA 168 TaxID=2939568 RepID=UPI000AC6CCE4|nr:hypothetical protein [Niallia sp. MER TA 168]
MEQRFSDSFLYEQDSFLKVLLTKMKKKKSPLMEVTYYNRNIIYNFLLIYKEGVFDE